MLAKNGLKVNVVERNPWVGGGVVTREVTLPGFKHDLFGSSHVWIHLNPDFKDIKPDLEKHGLKYIWSDDHITGHPNKFEDEGIIVYKDVDKTCNTIAEYSKKDATRYKEIYNEFGEIQDGVVKTMIAPPAPPSYLYQGLENNPQGMTRLRDYQLSSRQFTLDNFENDHVRAFILGWAMAPQTLPDQLGTAAGFYVMIPSIHYYGQSIPEGGSGMLSESMKSYLEASGSSVTTGATVRKFIVENGECKGLRLEDGTDMDKTAFQRIFGTVADIDKQYSEMARGLAPSDPFLWTAAWTTMDPTRAPDGKHTLIMCRSTSPAAKTGKASRQIMCATNC